MLIAAIAAAAGFLSAANIGDLHESPRGEATEVKNPPEAIAHRVPWSVLETGLLLLLLYLYFWLVIDPRLIHHSIGIMTLYRPFSFHTGWPFFAQHLARAGGIGEYGARLGSQFYSLGWAGALIITAAAWCAGFFAEWLCRRAGSPRGRVLCYAAVALVLVMHNGYSHPLHPILSLLAGLGGFLLFVRFAPRTAIKRIPVFLVMFLVSYHVAGAGSLIFPVMVAVDELLIGGRKAVAALALISGLIVPWAAVMLFGGEFTEAYGSFLLSEAGVSPGKWPHTLALYLFFPTVLAGTAGAVAARPRTVPPVAERGPRRDARSVRQESRHSPARRLLTRPVAITLGLCGLGALAWLSLHSVSRTILEIDYFSQQERWGEVLRSADRLPRGLENIRCERNILLALYHTGRLGDEMYRYSLRAGAELFGTPESEQDYGSYYQESRLLLELGQVNQAAKCAYEALETSGDQPIVLAQLATINIVKRQPETARIFLRALARHPFQRRAAQEELRRLEEDPGLENDPRVSRIRANAVAKDFATRYAGVEAFLDTLLEKNPHNRLAFELLMAYGLHTGHLDLVVRNLERLRDFSFATVPRHYQEAWLIHHGLPDNPPPIPGFELDPEVVRRARDFRRITARAARPQEAAMRAWEAGLGDSYFFYYLRSGLLRR
jgi:tetratricopeptide (TPR) repeat protein